MSLVADDIERRDKESKDRTADPIYQGVGGWLLVFCIILTIINPLSIIYLAVTDFLSLAELSLIDYPGAYIDIISANILRFGLAVFSMCAGLALWRIRPHAVQLTKNFLWSSLVCSILLFILPIFLLLWGKYSEIYWAENIQGLLQGLGHFALWYGYLANSRRVRETYSLPLPERRICQQTICPQCGAPVELSRFEQRARQYSCPHCNQFVDLAENPELRRTPILPEIVVCPYCGTELELEVQEREDGQYICPRCGEFIGPEEAANTKVPYRLPENITCPRCRRWVILGEGERKEASFICPFCHEYNSY